MKRLYVLLCAMILTALSLQAHEDRVTNFEQLMRLTRITETEMVSFPGGKCMMYRLYLRDKDLQHSPYSVSRPEEFLSPRAIERRKRQNLSVDATDLPISPAYIDSVREAGIEIVGKSKWNNTLLVRIHKEKELSRLQRLSFINKALKVFSSPDSITERKRSSFRKELNQWEPYTNNYGAPHAYTPKIDQLLSKRGKRHKMENQMATFC